MDLTERKYKYRRDEYLQNAAYNLNIIKKKCKEICEEEFDENNVLSVYHLLDIIRHKTSGFENMIIMTSQDIVLFEKMNELIFEAEEDKKNLEV